ncbi:MAG TPA: sulfurtransferase TusA family protein [Solirubrobacteraceae bacterium]|nr:sulfurtransferase TusA family protein [Solirubrobacteraceae bacterium]HSD79847.1 sulfurtransferase TusA family protein [Solirubrobacteraceae bacterium]
MPETTPPLADSVLDARGLLCPMPVLKAAKHMRTLQPGQVLKLLSTDRGSLADVPAWAADTGNELLATHEEDGAYVFLLRRGED